MSLLVLAAVSDIRERRVPNWLNLLVLLTGLLLARGWPVSTGDIGRGLAGIGVGLALWFPMYLLRLVGAGDVKLVAASGAWLGSIGVMSASLFTALAGGVLGALWILKRQGWHGFTLAMVHAIRAPRLLQLTPMDRRERVPYAVAIAVGVLAARIYGLELFAAFRGD